MATQLVDETTGQVINIGDTRNDFRGDPAEIVGWTAPTHPGSTGRIHVRSLVSGTYMGVSEYFPSVFNARIVEVPDRKDIWTYRSQAMYARDEDEARMLITHQALSLLPEASVDILSIRRTPTGRYSAIVKRTR